MLTSTWRAALLAGAATLSLSSLFVCRHALPFLGLPIVDSYFDFVAAAQVRAETVLQADRPLRIAVVDSFDEAHEVIGPLVYSLSKLPNVQVSLFKTRFKAGFLEVFEPYFPGTYRRFDEFFYPRDTDDTSVHNARALFLTTAERDLPLFLNRTTVTRFPRLEKLRTFAVSHRPSRHYWKKWALAPDSPEALATAVGTGSLSFVTLAPHVNRALHAFFDHPAFKNLSFPEPQVDTFVPVLPNILQYRQSAQLAKKGECNTAIWQGAHRAANFNRLQEELVEQIRVSPAEWGYKTLTHTDAQDTIVQRFIPDPELDGPPFTLLALGRGDPDNPFRVLPALQGVIRVHTDLPYDQFWPTIQDADIILTGWPLPKSRYIKTMASSTIPTAVMLRLPTLLTAHEAETYGYLGGPAALRIEANETEIQALARLRRNRGCHPGATSDWDALERQIEDNNAETLTRMLSGLRTSDLELQMRDATNT